MCIKNLCVKYPTCHFSFKEVDTKFIIDRMKNNNPKNGEITNNLILEKLKEREFSARQISRHLGYAYCTIIHHLGDLKKKQLVSYRKVENRTYLWNYNKTN